MERRERAGRMGNMVDRPPRDHHGKRHAHPIVLRPRRSWLSPESCRPRFRWNQIWYHRGVNAAVLLQEARRRSGLSRRQLAQRGGTSASTLSAYESGTSVPSVSTLARLLRAAGFEAEATLRPVPSTDEREVTEKI